MTQIQQAQIASLHSNGAFQELMLLLEDHVSGLARAILLESREADILSAHSRAKGSAELLAYIKSTVSRLSRETFGDKL